MEKDQVDILEDFDKPDWRREYDRELPKYLARGGTIKVIKPPYDKPVIIECDIFTPGEGSSQSHKDVKDTMVRVPRPEKKFGKK